jgi:3-hydroxyisobutyrate dehydrogenase
MKVEGSSIAFIGTGVMGISMAGHLMKAGAKIKVYNRTKEKSKPLLDAGAVWAETPADAAKDSTIVFTMVGYPADVEEVYFGEKGVFNGAAPGTILVDFTTSDPKLAVRIAERAASKKMYSLDAPVSGGDLGARNAALTIMAGGDNASFDKVIPFFQIMGKTVVLQGGPGAGQHTKMANQIAIAGSLCGAVEAVIYAESAGLDPKRVLDSIGGGSAQSWQLLNMVPRMLDGNFDPGFYSKHFLKDLRIALNSAKSMKVKLPLLEMAEHLFVLMSDEGFAEKGTHALYLLYKNGLIK